MDAWSTLLWGASGRLSPVESRHEWWALFQTCYGNPHQEPRYRRTGCRLPAVPSPRFTVRRHGGVPFRRAQVCRLGALDLALVRVDVAEVLQNLERAALGAGDVHVHPHVALAGDHLRGASRTLGDPSMVERGDHIVLVERAGFGDGDLPKLESPVGTSACAPRREHGAPGVRASYRLRSSMLNGSSTSR